MKRKLYEKSKAVTDYETGEIRFSSETTIYHVKDEGAYVKLYLEDLLKLHDIPKGPRCLFFSLLEKIDYDGNIFLNKALKEIICGNLEIQEQTFRSYLVVLTKSGLLQGKGGGLYVMNPEIAAKGDRKHVIDLRKKFNMTIEYNKNERKIKLDQ